MLHNCTPSFPLATYRFASLAPMGSRVAASRRYGEKAEGLDCAMALDNLLGVEPTVTDFWDDSG
jgi:hypothetical protein